MIIAAEPVYFRLQFGNKLGPLLREDVEQAPKFAVLDVFGSVPESFLASPACTDESIEYGYHFIVVHISPPSPSKGAIAVPLVVSAVPPVMSFSCLDSPLGVPPDAGSITGRTASGTAVYLQDYLD